MKYDIRLLQLLMEIGYIASGNGMANEAQHIFTNLAELRPESEMPLIGLAVHYMNRNQPKKAVETLWEGALQRNSESELAKSFLALALKKSGLEHESRILLEEVIQNNKDEQACALATALMNEAS